MFIRFGVSNYLSFDEEFECSLQASEDDNKRSHVVDIDNCADVLKSGIIFGANASGKTNLLKAIATLKYIVSHKEIDASFDRYKFLLADDSSERATMFEIEFSVNSTVYSYGISISKGIVEEEYLYKIALDKEIMLYRREHDFANNTIDIDFKARELENSPEGGLDLEHKKVVLELLKNGLLKENELMLKYKDLFDIKELSDVLSFFTNYLIIYNKDDNFPYFDKEKIYVKNALFDDYKFKKFTDSIIQKIDLGVDKFFFYNSDLKKFFDSQSDVYTSKEIEKSLLTKRYIANDKIIFDLSMESSGTQEIINLLFYLYCVHSDDYVCLIDDYGLHLHSNLAVKILHFILNEDLKGQLLLTSHNTKLLSLELFRQDEIYFMNTNKEKRASYIYSLLEYAESDNISIEKNYLQGKYNAIPIIEDLKLDKK